MIIVNRNNLPTLNLAKAQEWGQQLRSVRLSQQLSLDFVADRLLLSKMQIEGLESGNSKSFYGARLYGQAADKYATLLGFADQPSVSMIIEPNSDTDNTPAPPAATIASTAQPAPALEPVSDNIILPETVVEPQATEHAVIEEIFDPVAHATPQERPVTPAKSHMPPPTSGSQPASKLRLFTTVMTTATVTAILVLNANQLESFVRTQIDALPTFAELTDRFRSPSVAVDLPKARDHEAETTATPPAPTPQEEPAPAPTASSAQNNGPFIEKPDATTLKPAPMPTPVIETKPVAGPLPVSNIATDTPIEKPAPRTVAFAITSKTAPLMSIQFGTESWVQATTKDGKRIERTYNEGDTLTVQPSNLTLLTIGNSTKIKATLDGAKLNLDPYAKGSVARFSGEQLETLGGKAVTPAKPATVAGTVDSPAPGTGTAAPAAE